MKRIALVLCMSLVLAASIGVVVQADPPANSTCNTQCNDLGDLGLTHGQCVSFCTSCTNNGNTDANCFCNFLDAIGAIGPDGVFRNFGQCISTLK